MKIPSSLLICGGYFVSTCARRRFWRGCSPIMVSHCEPCFQRRTYWCYSAIKCNPNPEVLRLLAELGPDVDCALEAKFAILLDLGVDPSTNIYAQPKTHRVKQMTLADISKLHKIKHCFPATELFLCIPIGDSVDAIPVNIQKIHDYLHKTWKSISWVSASMSAPKPLIFNSLLERW